MTIKLNGNVLTIATKPGILSIGKCWIDRDKIGWIWYPYDGDVIIKKINFKNLKFF